MPGGQPAASALPGTLPPQAAQLPGGDGGASWYSGTFGAGCSPATCCEICGGGSGPPPDYYIEADVRVLSRSKPDLGPVITLQRVAGDPGIAPTALQFEAELSFRNMLEGILARHVGHHRPLPGTRFQ